MSLTLIHSLISWARHHGAQFHEQIEVYDDPQHGISLRVGSPQQFGNLSSNTCQSAHEKGNFPANSRIVSCPFSLSLSFLNALNKFPELKSHTARFPALFLEVLEPHIIGNFFLVQQFLNADISHWGPYIRSLPQPEDSEKLGTPLYFTEADSAWIHGTDLEIARDLREKAWKSDWQRAQRILDASSGWEEWQGKWTWEKYKWAATIFSSRSFISTLIPEEILKMPVTHGTRSFDNVFPVLFPLLDLANHSSTARVTWFTNARTEPKDLSIIAEVDIPYGQQVFNNYAPKNNTELMLGYGFCIRGNDEVGIAFKPLGEELVAIRKQHLTSMGSHGGDINQTIFHVRAAPYTRSTDDNRLLEFKLIEDGGVDALAVLTANWREREYMILHPNHCPERSSEAVFMGPLSRNMLKVLSVLLARLEAILEKIVSGGEHLGIPLTSCQKAAKIYRDGQISVLQNATRLIQLRLDAAMAQNVACDRTHDFRFNDAHFVDMRLNLQLVTLQCAFNWLRITHPTVHEYSMKIIAKELELPGDYDPDWIELLNAGWDYTLWCLWIYLVLLLRSLEKTWSPPLNQVTHWIKQMLRVYNTDGTFSGWPFQSFHGDNDENETLSLIANQVSPGIYLDTSIIDSMRGIDDANHKLMNFASTIAMEETFAVNVEMEVGEIKLRVHQRVLFMSKFPDLDDPLKEQSIPG